MASTHPPDQLRTTATVGLDTALGMCAFSRGDWRGAVAHLTQAAPHWGLLGGSHVQRDVFESKLLDALTLAGTLQEKGEASAVTLASARSLASKRVTLNPQAPQRWWTLGAVLAAGGDPLQVEGALGAKNRARALGLNQGPSY